MRDIDVGQAEIGDVVAEPVVNEQGRVLLPKGAKLSPAVLSRLRGWGVTRLQVEGEDTAGEDGGADEAGSVDEALLDALEHRFAGCEEDEVMMAIKKVARAHLKHARGQAQ